MELSEAKEYWNNRLNNMRAILKNNQPKNPVELLERDKYKWEADSLEVVLKASDNIVSKEYHEMVVKEQNDIIDDLKSKLDNSISKDKVQKKIEELELLKKALPIRTEIPRYINYLQELLGEE